MSAFDPPSDHRTVCAFCRLKRKMSNEHAFPGWIEKRCLPGDRSTKLIHTRQHQDGSVQIWGANELSFKVKICETCNTGWMNDLEVAVEPIICPMINAPVPVSLSTDDLQTISLWFTKTVYMLDFAHGELLVPASFYEALYRHRQPPGDLSIWSAAYGGPTPSLRYKRQTLGFVPVAGDAAGREKGYLVTVLIGHLILQALHVFRGRVDQFEDGSEFVVPIWPSHRPEHWPPVAGTNSVHAMDDDALQDFADRIGPRTS